ncbi:MAG: DUF4315 family protein [Lachnospiraceae bacterium]|nr:DUF4315 family protein [Lachnospiraceae bacterium]
MSKKLSRYIVEIEKTEKKIEELKEHLSNLRRKQKLDEDLEIVRSIRDIKMSSRELADILDGIQNGSIAFQSVSSLEAQEEFQPEEEILEPGTDEKISGSPEAEMEEETPVDSQE